MRTKRAKSSAFLLISLLAVTLPFGVLWYRNLPPSTVKSDSASQLWVQVFKQQQNRIEKELGQRDSSLVKQSDSTARWEKLEQSVREQGATAKEARIVLSAARSLRPTIAAGVAAPHWPILIQKGFVEDRRVWVSVCAASDPSKTYAKPGEWVYWVRVIDPTRPQAFSDKHAANRGFLRGSNIDSLR